MQDDLKVQHLIILTALFVSLFGSLLVLDKINDNAVPITGAAATIDIYDHSDTEQEDETMVRIVRINATGTG